VKIDNFEAFKMANEMALKWFEIHAGQRMAMMRFFLIAAGFCVAGYMSALQSGNLGAAGVISLLLICFALLFKQLDRRTAQLVGLAEDFLRSSGTALERELGAPEVNIAAKAEQRGGVPSYRQTFNLIYWFVGLLGLSGVLLVLLRFGP
jgi:hypothetical protein